MQINKPNPLKDAFDAGYAAFSVYDDTRGPDGRMKGWPLNPYYKNSLAFKDWERGFNAAYFDNQRVHATA